MVGIAQLVERRLVVADVAGSSPVTHPRREPQVGIPGLRFLALKVPNTRSAALSAATRGDVCGNMHSLGYPGSA